jgi:hypothetical protein
MSDLRKYGVGTTFLVPMIKAGAADFAATGDWTPAAGDVKVSKDDGAFANVGTLPTAVGNHWKFTLSATEMEAARVVVQVVDSATKAVEDQSYIITTYGNASAQHAFDLDTALTGYTVSDLAAVPAANAGWLDALSFLFMGLRNKRETTATTDIIRKDDASTAAGTSTISDNGTTFTKGEYS